MRMHSDRQIRVLLLRDLLLRLSAQLATFLLLIRALSPFFSFLRGPPVKIALITSFSTSRHSSSSSFYFFPSFSLASSWATPTLNPGKALGMFQFTQFLNLCLP